METLGLKNVNMLTKAQYDTIAEPVKDELYAISGSGFGFPSDRFEELELGASGTSYTAPANGYCYINKVSSGVGQYIAIASDAYGLVTRAHASGDVLRLLFPVRKGKTFKIDYNAGGTTNNFRFIYAEGE